MIPKNIHYCWFGGEIPSRNQEIINSWKLLMPEYKFYFWGNANLSDINIPFIKQAVRKRHFAFVSDYFRLQKVYEYGGFYLDTDMHLIKSLDSLLNYDFVICSEVPQRPSWAFFGAAVNNALVKNCSLFYHDFEYDEFKPPVIPYLFSESVISYIAGNTCRSINLSADYFYPLPQEKAGHDYTSYIRPVTIGVHLWDFSWSEVKKNRGIIPEVFYRFYVLFIDFFHFDYSLYYFKINLIRIGRLFRR